MDKKINGMNEVDLRRELVNFGLGTHGNKSELQSRLKKYMKENKDAVLLADKEDAESVEMDEKRGSTSPAQNKKGGVSFAEPSTKKKKKEKELEAYKDQSSESEGEYEIAQEIPKEAEEVAKNAFAYNIRENIKRFFKYNKNHLVREKLTVDENEAKKARGWVFFLILLQITVNFAYGWILLGVDRQIILWIVCGALGFYAFIKLFSVILFTLRRANKLSSCCGGKYDPSEVDKYNEILICIPAYNEGKEAFINTIESVCASNYPHEKLYMFFIVDGNRGNCFEAAMSVLNPEWKGTIKGGERALEHGVYKGVGYSIFCKEQNRGKRDSQWLFVELLRNIIPQFKPPFVFFVDSDTSFEPDSLRYLEETLKSDDSYAGVCGKLALSNFGCQGDRWDNWIFHASTFFVVGLQYYEYHFNQILGKQAEAAFDSVTCLPGAFSLLRSEILTTIEAHEATEDEKKALKEIEEEKSILLTQSAFGKISPFSFFYNKYRKTLPLILSDFFSRPTLGIVDRNLYELGEDRTLTIRMLEKKRKTTYDPRAVAYTECPDTIRLFMLQRRRWNNSTFVNLLMMLFKPKLWLQFKTFPIMIFTLYDLIGSYLMPTNALLMMALVWDPLFVQVNSALGTRITGPNFVIGWFFVTVLVISTTKMDTSDMFYVLNTFITSVLMLASLYFFALETLWPPIEAFGKDPSADNIPLFIIIVIFPLIHLVVSISRPMAFFASAFFYIMFPTATLVIPIYSFFRLDDFSWGNR